MEAIYSQNIKEKVAVSCSKPSDQNNLALRLGMVGFQEKLLKSDTETWQKFSHNLEDQNFKDRLERSSKPCRSQECVIRAPASANTILCVKAGPGTGKTFTLSRRIEALIESGMNPNEILVLSMTNRAVGALARSLSSFLGPESHAIQLFTFHSFCSMISAEYGSAFLSCSQRRFMSDWGWRSFISIFTAKKVGINGHSIGGIIDPVKLERILLQIKAKQYTVAEAAKNYEISPKYLEALLEYLDSNGIIRYSDLVSDALQILDLSRHTPVPCIAKIKAVFVDEFQDMHPLLLQLVRAVISYPTISVVPWDDQVDTSFGHECNIDSSDTKVVSETEITINGLISENHFHAYSSELKHLTLAGDPNQCIYDFLGADPHLLQNLAHHFPGAEITEMELDVSFRMTPETLEAVRAAIVEPILEPDSECPPLKSTKPESQKPIIYTCDSAAGERLFIGSEIIRLILQLGGLLRFSDFAILTRSNRELDVIKKTLESSFGLQTSLLGPHNRWENSLLHLFMDILQILAAGPGSDISLLSILVVLDTAPLSRSRIAMIFNSTGAGSKVSIEEFIKSEAESSPMNASVYKKPKERESLSRIVRFLKVVEAERLNIADFHTLSKLLAALLRIVQALDLLSTINADDGLEERLQAFGRSLIMSHTRYISGPPPQNSFIEHFMLLYCQETNPHVDFRHVNLSTIHTAKGLEFPVVFMPGVSGQFKPGGTLTWESILSRKSTLVKRSEACLFYVGCTRSSQLLYIGTRKNSYNSLSQNVSDFFTTDKINFDTQASQSVLILDAISQGLNRKMPPIEKVVHGHALYAQMMSNKQALVATRSIHMTRIILGIFK